MTRLSPFFVLILVPALMLAACRREAPRHGDARRNAAGRASGCHGTGAAAAGRGRNHAPLRHRHQLPEIGREVSGPGLGPAGLRRGSAQGIDAGGGRTRQRHADRALRPQPELHRVAGFADDGRGRRRRQQLHRWCPWRAADRALRLVAAAAAHVDRDGPDPRSARLAGRVRFRARAAAHRIVATHRRR